MLHRLMKSCAHDGDGYPIIPDIYLTDKRIFRLWNIVAFVEIRAGFVCKFSVFRLL